MEGACHTLCDIGRSARQVRACGAVEVLHRRHFKPGLRYTTSQLGRVLMLDRMRRCMMSKTQARVMSTHRSCVCISGVIQQPDSLLHALLPVVHAARRNFCVTMSDRTLVRTRWWLYQACNVANLLGEINVPASLPVLQEALESSMRVHCLQGWATRALIWDSVRLHSKSH